MPISMIFSERRRSRRLQAELADDGVEEQRLGLPVSAGSESPRSGCRGRRTGSARGRRPEERVLLRPREAVGSAGASGDDRARRLEAIPEATSAVADGRELCSRPPMPRVAASSGIDRTPASSGRDAAFQDLAKTSGASRYLGSLLAASIPRAREPERHTPGRRAGLFRLGEDPPQRRLDLFGRWRSPACGRSRRTELVRDVDEAAGVDREVGSERTPRLASRSPSASAASWLLAPPPTIRSEARGSSARSGARRRRRERGCRSPRGEPSRFATTRAPRRLGIRVSREVHIE